MQENYLGMKSRFAIDLGLSAFSLSMVYDETSSKIKKISKLTRSTCPLSVFAQAICTGYETNMSQLILEEKSTPPIKKQETKNSPKTFLSKVQDDIKRYIFSVDGLKENFLKPFETSFSKQMAKIDRLDDAELLESTKLDSDRFARELLTNRELSYEALDSLELFGGIDRSIRLGTNTEKSAFFRFLEYGIRVKFALISASISTMLVNIDRLGRSIGKKIAILSKLFFGSKFSKSISSHVLPVMMSLIFLYKEVLDLVVDSGVGLINSGLFYPLCTGIAVSMYEIVKNENPKFFETHQKFKKSLPDKNMTVTKVIEECIDDAENRYKKYENKFVDSSGVEKDREEVTRELLLRSPGNSKKLLECRRAFFSICKNESSCISKYANFAKFCLVALRAWTLSLHALVARTTFTIAKAVAKPVYHFYAEYINEHLDDVMTKAISSGSSVVKENIEIKTKSTFHEKDFVPSSG